MNRHWLPYTVLFVMTGLGLTACRPSPAAVPGYRSAPGTTLSDTAHWPASFAIGRLATQAAIDSQAIAITPDGRGLPPGTGTATAGKNIYAVKCAACHGQTGAEGPFNKLVGPMGDTAKAKTIGNYWPYATTLFDYIRRAMPYNEPGSLSNTEVYQLTAYLLHANRIIDSTTLIDAHSLPLVQMPARSLFVNDDRQGGPAIR